jgi:glycine betaine catabolism B
MIQSDSPTNFGVYAIDEICTHEGGPLDEGELNGYDLKCPWHYAVFDVRDGKVSDATVWYGQQTSILIP